jgi:phenylacetate-CoA ligase
MRVTGRDDDMLIIRGVNVFPSQVEAVLVGFPGIAPHYQLVVTSDGALDAMTIDVEVAAGSPADDASRQARAAEVARHIKAHIGLTCAVSVKLPGELPRSQGKAVRVKDQRTRR